MKITLQKSEKLYTENDLLIIPVFKNSNNTISNHKKSEFETSKTIKEIDDKFDKYLLSSALQEGFQADDGQVFTTSTLGKLKTRALAFIGLGASHEQNVDLFRRLGGDSFKLAQKKRAQKVGLIIPEKITIPLFDVIEALAEGFHLASYQFTRYQTKEKKENFLKEIELYTQTAPSTDTKLALERAEIISSCVNLARDLVNEGPMELNPEKFSEHATKVARDGELGLEILDEKKLKKEKMGLLLAVASAAQSVAPPRLIKLSYKPKKSSKRKIVLVGKGVTFDSGGLDIKTADGMLDMKIDMSGAAAVLGVLSALASLKPKIEVVGYMACVENGVGPHSYHPGDILVSRKGITVEINNTDAEGRLLLADTFNYAIEKDHPDTIIDIATLTGACMIALGTKTAGLFSNDDDLSESLCRSGSFVGESFWRMPLNSAVKESLKSSIADIKNSGERYGGSISAALFLQDFIEPGIKWAHLDIAGPATNSKPHCYLPIGGVGFGVRTLINYIMGQQ